MTPYKFQDEVRIRAVSFISDLALHGISANLLEHSFRDYSVKVSVAKDEKIFGNVIIYFKPQKDSYTLGTHELKNKTIIPELEEIWHKKETDQKEHPFDTKEIHAYVDGSFIDNVIGYGVVLLQRNEIIHEISGIIQDPAQEILKIRQVGGEIKAVKETLAWAQATGIQELHLHYDYEGLESWATGKWGTNNQYTSAYQQEIQNSSIAITWHKIESHSGDRWNDRADALARNAAQPKEDLEIDQPDLIAELMEISQSFIKFLTENGVSASYDNIYNNMHARIMLYQGNKNNFLDIYNTKKKRLDPKWHGFTDQQLRDHVKELWQSFFREKRQQPDSGHEISQLDPIDYYYNIFKAYQNLNFDFIEFANALKQMIEDDQVIDFAPDELRYDFAELEKVYRTLKGKNHE